MAAPGLAYAEALDVAHQRGVGYSVRVRGRTYTVDAKDVLSEHVWRMTVSTDRGDTWILVYRESNDGTVGKFYYADDGTSHWYPDGADGWRSKG